MIGERLLRLAARMPGIPSDIANWYDEMKQIADAAQQQRIEDEAQDERDRQDMARWLKEPDRRRPRPGRDRT